MPHATYVADLPFSKRKALCGVLDMNAKWSDLASELGYDQQAKHAFSAAVYRLAGFNSPSEDLITEYCHRNPTIDELYFKLMKLQLYTAALTIQDYVSKAGLQAGDAKSLRDPGEQSEDRGGLPTPSQRPISLKEQTIQGPSAFGYTHDPFVNSNSNNSSPSGFAPNGYGSHNEALPAQPPSYQSPLHTPTHSGLVQHRPQRQMVYQPPIGYSFEHVGEKNPHDLEAAPVFMGGGPPRSQFQSRPQPLRMPNYGQISGPYSGQFVNTGDQIGYYQQQQQQQQTNRTYEPLTNNSERMDLSFSALKRATYGFDKRKIVSQDRFGVVFRGKHSDQSIAVKQMRKIVDEKSGFDITTHLLKEVDILKRCNHSNIVRLLQFIDPHEGEGNIYLVYPFMDHGSLRKNLKENQSFKWEFRIKIMMQAASGLVYLHKHLADQPYIHGDISSENILLDANMTAKLSGFGLAQAATGGTEDGQKTHVSQAFLKNTLFGAEEYKPPEFKEIPELSVKGDIFAFGVVILETCTGLSAYDDRREGGKMLWQYVTQLGSEYEKFAESLNDKRQPMPSSVWLKVFQIGLKCISQKKKNRPYADRVRQSLDDIVQNDMRRNSKTGMNKTATEQPAVSVKSPDQDERPQTPFYAGVTSPMAAQNSMYSGHTPLKRPVDQDEQVNSLREGQRPTVHPDYSIVSPDFDKGCGMFSSQLNPPAGGDVQYGMYNTSSTKQMADVESDERNDTDEIIFERPGNTTEIPVFAIAQVATDPNVKANATVGVYLESDSFRTGSNYSSDLSPKPSSLYDNAQSDLSILTGSSNSGEHDQRKSDMETFSGSSSASKQTESKLNSPYFSSDLSSCETSKEDSSQPTTDNNEHAEEFDFRKNDLDILSGSSSRNSSKVDSSLSHEPISSAASTNYSQDTLSSENDVSKATAPGYFPSASDSTDYIALQVLGLNIGAIDMNDKAATNTELPVSPIVSDLSDNIPPAQIDLSDLPTPGGNNLRKHLEPLSPAGPESLLDDPVQLNDSVIHYMDNSRYTSATSSDMMLPSQAINTLEEADFNFNNFTQEDPVAIDVTDTCAGAGAQYNLSTMKNKADDMFDIGDDETCTSFNDGSFILEAQKDFSWNGSFGMDSGLIKSCDSQM